MKKIISLILICFVAVSCHTKNKETKEPAGQNTGSVVIPADTGYLIGKDIPEYRDLPRQFVANQDRSMGYHQNLMDSFEASGHGTELTRPEYFGGAYINDDGNFVILIKGNPADYRREFEERVKGGGFILKETDVSNAELFQIMETVGQYMAKRIENNDIAKNIISAGVDIKNSRIDVGLEDLSPRAIRQFKENVIDSPYINFVAGEYIELV